LLLFDLLSELFSFGILCHGFDLVFLFLVLKHALSILGIHFFILSLLSRKACPLLIKFRHVLLSYNCILFLLLKLEGSVHFILMLDDGCPLIVNHLFLRDWQVPLLRGALALLLMA
jgi:hypothetical protein